VRAHGEAELFNGTGNFVADLIRTDCLHDQLYATAGLFELLKWLHAI